jgi:hypothetical protein
MEKNYIHFALSRKLLILLRAISSQYNNHFKAEVLKTAIYQALDNSKNKMISKTYLH